MAAGVSDRLWEVSAHLYHIDVLVGGHLLEFLMKFCIKITCPEAVQIGRMTKIAGGNLNLQCFQSVKNHKQLNPLDLP